MTRKRFNRIEHSKQRSKGIVFLSHLEQERLLNINVENIRDLIWYHDECNITFINSMNMYRIIDEKTSLIQNYFLFFKSHNHLMSNWHKRFIHSSISDDYYYNEDFNNIELYTLYSRMLRLFAGDVHCKNAYYYKLKCNIGFNNFLIDLEKVKPLSLKLQCAQYIIHKMKKMDLKNLLLEGYRYTEKCISKLIIGAI